MGPSCSPPPSASMAAIGVGFDVGEWGFGKGDGSESTLAERGCWTGATVQSPPRHRRVYRLFFLGFLDSSDYNSSSTKKRHHYNSSI
jgi:hypothetical protein